jgi:hypothetical protein
MADGGREVLLVVGFAASLPENHSEIIFNELESFIAPVSAAGVKGIVQYSYEPVLVVQQ